MKRFKVYYGIALILVASYLALLLGIPGIPRAHAQTAATDTAQPGGAYVTNTYSDEPFVNVRVGPNTASYSVCGNLAYGATAPALGTTPANVWVQIQHPDCPGGVGWVYAAFVSLTGTLRVVEPPPTPTPLATATFDPTLVAAFHVEPTVTRLPTFTPPPPAAWPTFTDTSKPRTGLPVGATILGIAALGGLVLAISLVSRR
ncbi:MAG TPA: SH3 domain-containing protein [Anaerolineales bacterium]|nr:SH3 domain-containing protein [Anaerolineales bacterium]